VNNRWQFAYDPNDTDDVRLEKFAILLVSGSCCVAGVVWSLMYYMIFGPGLISFWPVLFVIIVGTTLVISHITRNHYVAVYGEIACIIFITAFIQWSIGGVLDSGVVLVWAFLGPICALMFFSIRQSVVWFLIYLTILTITVVFDDFFARHGQDVTETVRQLFFLMNLGIASAVVFLFAGYFVSAALRERKRADRLLLNVLPKEIAPILKSTQGSTANYYESVSILFADIVGSTPLFAELEPVEAVDRLNDVFSMFDRLVEKHGVEKIGTIGDSYVVASGVPTPRSDHAVAVADLALDMVAQLHRLPKKGGKHIDFRLGINTGPVVAGVIGQARFHYDIWGDTVNTASRMESHGEAGKIHITEAMYHHIKDDFNCVPRGTIPIKGKGDMRTYFLVSRKTVVGHEP
jgi:adenylate cyclase